MRLIYGPSATRIRGNKYARRAVRAALSAMDPEAEHNPRYNRRDRRGERLWDGVHRFYNLDGRLIPTGLVPRLRAYLDEDDPDSYVLQGFPSPDEAVPEVDPSLLEGVTLRPYQVEGIRTALVQRRGVMRLPPRSGKTEMQIAVAKLHGGPSLLLVGRESLMQQHWERFQDRGVYDVGRYGSGRAELDHAHVVAMAQTLSPALMRGDKAAVEFLRSRTLLQCDEAHHLGSARSWFDIFSRSDAEYRLGWSGTPHRDHGRTGAFHAADWWLQGATGELIYCIPSQFLRDNEWIAQAHVRMIPVDAPRVFSREYMAAYAEGIVEHGVRNHRVVALAVNLARKGHRVLVLVTRLKHGKELLHKIEGQGVSAAFSLGGKQVIRWRRGSFFTERYTPDVIEKFRTGSSPILIGSTIYDEGVDLPWLTRLVNASGQKAAILTIQRSYRAMTMAEGKSSKVVIYDFTDAHHRTLASHAESRQRAYALEGLEVRFGPLPKVAQLA